MSNTRNIKLSQGITLAGLSELQWNEVICYLDITKQCYGPNSVIYTALNTIAANQIKIENLNK